MFFFRKHYFKKKTYNLINIKQIFFSLIMNEDSSFKEQNVEIPLLDKNNNKADPTIASKKKSYKNFKEFISKRMSIWEELSDREIYINEISLNYRSNKINTSKYTLLNFIPKIFYEQFSKTANLYFLIIGFLQTIEEISTSGGIPVIYFPLTLIIIVSAIKDVFEDLKRKKSDNQENQRKVQVLENGVFVESMWQNLKVGNIIKVHENEYFPTDILLIKTSDAKNVCFIETKNLDGETNLKRKNVAKNLNNLRNLSDFEVFIIFKIKFFIFLRFLN